MILDETGGPWAVSPVHGNPDPNEQHPVVIINGKNKEITYTGLFITWRTSASLSDPAQFEFKLRAQSKGSEQCRSPHLTDLSPRN